MSTKHTPQASVESVVSSYSYNASDSDSGSSDGHAHHVRLPGGLRPTNDSDSSLNNQDESEYPYLDPVSSVNSPSTAKSLLPPGLNEKYIPPVRYASIF